MWLLVAVGLAVAFRVFYPILKARRDPVSRTLVFQFGVRPTGRGGRWTPRDRVRSGLLSLVTGAVCVGVVIVAERIGERAMNLSTTSYVATGVMVLFVILAVLAVIRGVADLVRAPFTKVIGRPGSLEKIMSEIPLIDYANLDDAHRARLAGIVAVHTSLERVLTWGREQRPPVDIESILTQDEYTHDVLIPFEGRYLVYDTT